MTRDDLDLYYGHKAQEIILTNVRDTIHADSLVLFQLNIEILLVDVTRLEKSNILAFISRHFAIFRILFFTDFNISRFSLFLLQAVF